MRASGSAGGVGRIGGVERGKDRAADTRGRPAHRGALAYQRFDRAFLREACATVDASGEMLFDLAQLGRSQLAVYVG